MSRKWQILFIMLMLAIPVLSIASGPTEGGGINSGPGMSGPSQNEESQSNPAAPSNQTGQGQQGVRMPQENKGSDMGSGNPDTGNSYPNQQRGSGPMENAPSNR